MGYPWSLLGIVLQDGTVLLDMCVLTHQHLLLSVQDLYLLVHVDSSTVYRTESFIVWHKIWHKMKKSFVAGRIFLWTQNIWSLFGGHCVICSARVLRHKHLSVYLAVIVWSFHYLSDTDESGGESGGERRQRT
jgi:hypothetical protein